MGIFAELAKGKRNREDYRNQLRKLSVENAQKDQEIARLKRQLAAIKDFTERALA